MAKLNLTNTANASISTPASGITSVFVDTTKNLSTKDDAGALKTFYGSGDSPTFATITTTGGIELGNASDTTLLRVSGGVVSIEGNNIATNTSSPTFATLTTTANIELGNASDTTLSRVAAGILGVEGIVMNGWTTTATAGGTTTMAVTDAPVQFWTGSSTSQTVKLPTTNVKAGQTYEIRNNCTSTGIVTVQSSGANDILPMSGGCIAVFRALQDTPTTDAHWSFKKYAKNSYTNTSLTTDTGTTLNADWYDIYSVTAQAGALKFNNPTGTARNGQSLVLTVASSTTAARALTWDTNYEASTIALPTTTAATTAQLNIGFIYSAPRAKWVCVAVA